VSDGPGPDPGHGQGHGQDRGWGGVGWGDLGWGDLGEQVGLGLSLSLHYSVCMIM
jgi:hypothetical protein